MLGNCRCYQRYGVETEIGVLIKHVKEVGIKVLLIDSYMVTYIICHSCEMQIR